MGTRKVYYCENNPCGDKKKSVEAIKHALETVLAQAGKDFHVTFLRPDSEAAFQSTEITDLLRKKGIIIRIFKFLKRSYFR
jgi:hypothetical protein